MSNESTIQDVMEAVQGLSSHIDGEFANARLEMAAGFERMENRFDEKLALQKNDIITEIDRFVVLHQTLDIELVSLRSRCQRMESFMVTVAKQLNLEFEPT